MVEVIKCKKCDEVLVKMNSTLGLYITSGSISCKVCGTKYKYEENELIINDPEVKGMRFEC